MRKKFLSLVIIFSLLIIPNVVEAREINTSSAPEYLENENIFVANGTAIVISESDGNTYVSWNSGNNKVSVNSDTLIIGGYYNPYDGDNCTINLDKTSVVMNSGSVGYIIGGNVIDKSGEYDKYSKIYIGSINIDINGGSIKEVSAVTGANKYVNTALGSSYYDKIKSYYYADSVNIDISNAKVSSRIYVLSSYTYAKDVIINIDNGSTIKSGHYALAIGTNGVVDNFTVNIKDSSVDMVHSGFRTMVNKMVVNASGNTVIGDLYAGSYYGSEERYEDSNGWSGWNIGDIDYGQVGVMEFNLSDNTQYNNIYAGFQFVDKDKFYDKFGSSVASYAEGINNSENAKVIINIANLPSVTNSKLKSMIDTALDNVTISYVPNLDSVSTINKVESNALISSINSSEITKIFEETLKNNNLYLDSILNGENIGVTIETDEVTDKDLITKIEKKVQEENKSLTVVNYFDISVLVKNIDTGVVVDELSQLVSPIELSVKLPDSLSKVKSGSVRTYYIVREHDGEITLLDAKLSDDGSSLIFSTDKFSTYAIAYVDSNSVLSPKTYDRIKFYVGIGLVAIGSSVFGLLKVKRKLNRRKSS